MPKQKYDWSKIKLEFFQSDIDEVKVFFESKYGQWKRNWTMNRNTRWRTKEKQEMKANILKDAMAENAERQAKELSLPLEKIMEGKKAILQLLLVQVSKYVKESKSEKNIDVWNAERILRMFKTELWEPTNISKNDTTLRGDPLDESLFIED